MCTEYRTQNEVFHAGQQLDLLTHDGIVRRGKWAGSAKKETLKRKWPNSEYVQTPVPITEISEADAKDDDDVKWTAVPPGAHLIFALQPVQKTVDGEGEYRLAKLITTEATPSQLAYFRNDRVPMLGRLTETGEIEEIPPLIAPPPVPKRQGDLF